jgi:ElaB/YqjD/DUF883 family membrane-anchored ribosome-binding protein
MAERTSLATVSEPSEKPSQRSAEDIRQDIAAKRDSISETVDRLGERIHERLDWRSYVAEYPFVVMGLAAGAGFVLSGIFKRRPSPADRIVDALADVVEDVTDRVRGNLGEVIQSRRFGAGYLMKTGLIGIASPVISDFVRRNARTALGLSGRVEEENPLRRASTTSSLDQSRDVSSIVADESVNANQTGREHGIKQKLITGDRGNEQRFIQHADGERGISRER